jgi:hypothetical protein
MSTSVQLQDPGETLDYSVDWTVRLAAGDSVATSAWAISPSGPTLSGATETGSVATTLVTGLVLAGIYRLTNTVTTAEGQTMRESITIRCFPG